MKKFFKWLGIVLLSLIVIAVVGFQVLKYKTKQKSPQQTVLYDENGYDIEIYYSRPFKKDRQIFGGLVPYGDVWRTGANEATTFKTGTDLMIDGQRLPAGDYTLWTLPSKNEWKVMLNSGSYGWGVDFNQKASRKPDLDVVEVTSPTQKNFKVLEQFTIEVVGNPPSMQMSWDNVRVDVPITKP